MKLNEILKEDDYWGDSVTESVEKISDHKIRVKLNGSTVHIDYDDRPGIREWFMVAYPYNSETYVYTKNNKFERSIPIEQIGFHQYMPFSSSDEALKALNASSLYASMKDSK